MIRRLASVVRRGARLSAFETAVLGAVRACLDQRLVERWDAQVRAVNKVQRLPDGVETNFYRMRAGRPTFDSALAFPNQSDELLVAEIVVREGDCVVRASVWCVRGFVSAIEFDPSSKLIKGESIGAGVSGASLDCRIVGNLAQVVPPSHKFA